MNTKDVQELKRQLKWENDKLHILTIGEAYGKNGEDGPHLYCARMIDYNLVSQEEGELYLAILKKGLSGTLGKNLIEYGFDAASEQEGSMRKRLYALKNGELAEEQKFRDFALELLTKGDYRNAVYITAALCEYAVPDQNANREILEGSTSFRFVLVTICDARLTEIGLFYNREANEVQRKVNDEMQILDSPSDAFLYPCFTDRGSDVNHLLYHCKRADSPNAELIESFLQIPFTTSATEQSDKFKDILCASFENRLKPETAIALHCNISESIAQQAEEEGMVTFTKQDIKDLLLNSGADERSLEAFDSNYTLAMEDEAMQGVNMTEKGKVTIKAPSLSVSVKDDALEKIKTKEIDGKKYLLIELDDSLEISGLPVQP